MLASRKVHQRDRGSHLLSGVTVGIKHTSRFASRREKLHLLLASIRRRYPDRQLRILVADDGGAADREVLRGFGARHLRLQPNAGLSHGRNALVQATRTPFLVLLDDDTVFDRGTELGTLHQALRQHPKVALAAGCYIDLRYPNHTHPCFRARFHASEGGAVVRSEVVHTPPAAAGCERAHMGTNFFMARTSALRRFGWDPRQKVMEHETFYYQLFLNEQPVLVCANVTVEHNGSVDASSEYQSRSLRFKERAFMQFLCKDFPEVERFDTMYNQWRCDQRTYCQPDWGSEFAFDGESCQPMDWDDTDDRSMVPRRLVMPAIHPHHLFPLRPPVAAPAVQAAYNRTRSAPRFHVGLLVLIFSERAGAARRTWQRATWLRFRWHEAQLSQMPVPWRYVYVQGRTADSVEAELDVVHGDTVTLSAVSEGYRSLVHKTMEALRWALAVCHPLPRPIRRRFQATTSGADARIIEPWPTRASRQAASFDVLLKVDDDSMVHIGRLWGWLVRTAPRQAAANPWAWLYAGRVQRHAQVIRPNFTRGDLWRPQFFPADFLKWAVPHTTYARPSYPPYATGGGYLLGSDAVPAVLAGFDRLPASEVIPIEDAQVGILATRAGLTVSEAEGFRELPPSTAPSLPSPNRLSVLHNEVKTALLLHRLPAAPQHVFEALVGASHRCSSHVVKFGCAAM